MHFNSLFARGYVMHKNPEEIAMRRLLIALPLLTLAACSDGPDSHPIDPNHLPPLSGKEQALMVAADGEIRQGDTDSAIRDYQSAAAHSEGHIDAHLALAKLYISQQQSAPARDVLERALKLQPNDPEANYLLGKILIDQNHPREAAQHFSAGLVTAPNNAQLLNGSGIAADALGDHKAAQGYYQQALMNAGTDDKPMLRTNLGMSYLLDNNPKKAIDILKPEAHKPGASPVTRQDLALAYGLLGRPVDAKNAVKNEMTEEEREAALERLKAYLK